MIAYLKGVVAAKGAYGAVIDVGGVGYELSMSTHALAALPAAGNMAQVWTYLQVKEDGASLFGFADLAEKEMFSKLVGVSGIGPKIAIAALSTFRPEELAAAIAEGDVTRIVAVPGLGKKTAQRLVLELQGVLEARGPLLDGLSGAPSAAGEAAEALESMGFSSEEVAAALKGYSGSGADSAALIRHALKQLGGR